MKNSFPLVAGRVRTRSLETHLVDHCNLRCAACCSLSPHLPKWELDPAALEEDLRRARRVLAPTWMKLVGGEPLLHTRLLECMAVARTVQIAPIVSLTTNGFLLPRQPEEFWQGLDALTISLYPHPRLPQATVVLVEERAREYRVRINWKRQDRFAQMDRAGPCRDECEIGAVWESCWLRRRCHLVRDGRFYACTRPVHLQSLLGGDFLSDGVLLHEGPDLAEEIQAYLQRREPLAACALCFGGDAPQVAHRQLRSGEGPVPEGV